MKYRKKPVVIEAVAFDGSASSATAIIDWILSGDGTARYHDEGPSLMIDTLEGTMRADVGDFVIRGVKGEFYPVKPDVFQATYEPVEELVPCRNCENGEWWTECCDGSGGCSCKGEPINMGRCNVCHGIGKHPGSANTRANSEAIRGYGFIGTGPSSGLFSNLPRMGKTP
jgi:hypothetical protein